MLETMYAAPGVGLAAVQVGVLKRLVVLDVSEDKEEPQPLTLFNPGNPVQGLGDAPARGRLPVDPRFQARHRAPRGRDGRLRRPRRESARSLRPRASLATALQHEIDHLNGKLIIDFLSRLKRDIVVSRFKKQARGEAPL